MAILPALHLYPPCVLVTVFFMISLEFHFFCLPIACFVLGRRFAKLGERKWAADSMMSGIGMFVFSVLAGMGFSQVPGFADFAGVYQRLSFLVGLGWIT